MPAPERSLPSHPSLEQQRKQAKELLSAFRTGDAQARERIRHVLPDKTRIVLADAQHVLAREYGFASWSELTGRIAELMAHEAELGAGDVEVAGNAGRSGARPQPALSDELRSAVSRRDAATLRAFFERRPEACALIDAALFPFDTPSLVQAASWDDAALVRALLDAGADPNRRTDWWAGGFHALHHAQGAVARLLLDAGAVPDACAAASLDRIDLLETLLDEDPARVHERGGDGQLPLHFARSRGVIDMLLARGADPDARDIDHRSTAAEWMLAGRRGAGRYELARYLIERGASADVFMAAALGLTTRLEELLDADPAQIEARTGAGHYGEQPPSSLHMYTWTIGQDVSPLRTAVQFGQPAAVDVLLRFVVRDDLVLAAELAAAAGNGDAAVVRALLDARPDAARLFHAGGSTALHAAASAGRTECCRLLLVQGADPDARDRSDAAAPLHYAAEGGHLNVVRTLVEAGADVDGEGDEHLLGVLGWATCFGRIQREVADYLIASGARVGIFPAISLGRVDDVRRLIGSDRAVVEQRMNSGDMDLRTPVHHAAEAGNVEILELLLRAGADPNARNTQGARPASYVRGTDNRREILELLIRHGAEPDDLLTLLLLRRFEEAAALVRREPAVLSGAEDVPTPLHLAVSRQDAEAVNWLIERGADLNAIRVMGSCGVTPLHVAAAEDADEMARILVDAGADPTIRDTRWNADPPGWAEYLGSTRVRAVFR